MAQASVCAPRQQKVGRIIYSTVPTTLTSGATTVTTRAQFDAAWASGTNNIAVAGDLSNTGTLVLHKDNAAERTIYQTGSGKLPLRVHITGRYWRIKGFTTQGYIGFEDAMDITVESCVFATPTSLTNTYRSNGYWKQTKGNRGSQRCGYVRCKFGYAPTIKERVQLNSAVDYRVSGYSNQADRWAQIQSGNFVLDCHFTVGGSDGIQLMDFATTRPGAQYPDQVNYRLVQNPGFLIKGCDFQDPYFGAIVYGNSVRTENGIDIKSGGGPGNPAIIEDNRFYNFGVVVDSDVNGDKKTANGSAISAHFQSQHMRIRKNVIYYCNRGISITNKYDWVSTDQARDVHIEDNLIVGRRNDNLAGNSDGRLSFRTQFGVVDSGWGAQWRRNLIIGFATAISNGGGDDVGNKLTGLFTDNVFIDCPSRGSSFGPGSTGNVSKDFSESGKCLRDTSLATSNIPVEFVSGFMPESHVTKNVEGLITAGSIPDSGNFMWQSGNLCTPFSGSGGGGSTLGTAVVDVPNVTSNLATFGDSTLAKGFDGQLTSDSQFAIKATQSGSVVTNPVVTIPLDGTYQLSRMRIAFKYNNGRSETVKIEYRNPATGAWVVHKASQTYPATNNGAITEQNETMVVQTDRVRITGLGTSQHVSPELHWLTVTEITFDGRKVNAPTNQPPTISGIPTTSIVAGQTYTFTPAGSDPENQTLTYSIANKPSWATFNTATGQLSGATAAANVGTYGNIVISVSDGTNSVSLAPFGIAVTAASAPVWNKSSLSMSAYTNQAVQLDTRPHVADSSYTDAQLTFAWSGSSAVQVSSTGLLTLNSTVVASGSGSLTATNPVGAKASIPVTFAVAAPLAVGAPNTTAVSVNPASTANGTVLAIIPWTGGIGTIAAAFGSGGAHDSISLQVDAANKRVRVIMADRTKLPAPGNDFPAIVKLTDTDSSGTVKATATAATLTISTAAANNPPVGSPSTFSIQTPIANGTEVGKVVASDPDGTALAYGVSQDGSGGAIAFNTSTGVFTVNNATLLVSGNKTFTMTVTASDGVTTIPVVNTFIVKVGLPALENTVVRPSEPITRTGQVLEVVKGKDGTAPYKIALVSQDTDGAYAIDANGTLVVADHTKVQSTGSSATLRVSVTDATGASQTVTVYVVNSVTNYSRTVEAGQAVLIFAPMDAFPIRLKPTGVAVQDGTTSVLWTDKFNTGKVTFVDAANAQTEMKIAGYGTYFLQLQDKT